MAGSLQPSRPAAALPAGTEPSLGGQAEAQSAQTRWPRHGLVADDQSMRIVVQRVRTSWTKASRGGAGAAMRSAAPTTFPLPTGLTSALHDVSMQEADLFVPCTPGRRTSASPLNNRGRCPGGVKCVLATKRSTS